MDFLGGIDKLDEETLSDAADLTQNRDQVLDALSDILIKHDVKPALLAPTIPISSGATPAGTEDLYFKEMA